MKNTFIILIFIFLTKISLGQHIVKGRVVDRNKMALKGATISDRNNFIFVATDKDGRFTYRSSSDSIKLSVRLQGYTPIDTLLKGKIPIIEIILQQENRMLEEVTINTGYQKIPKERATGSFVVLDEKLLNRRASTNVLQQIEGLSSGLQFDNRTGSPQVNIRGINTLSSGLSQPLIVVDNFPYEGDISNINPAEVASVNILKDAAATSIYGARAANGVIVINLKKPAQNGRLEAAFNTIAGEKPNLFYAPTMSSSDFIDVELFLYDKGFYKNALANRNRKTLVFSPVVSLLEQVSLGKTDINDAMAQIENYRNQDYRKDLGEKFYRPSVTSQLNMNYSFGGKDNISRVALGYQLAFPQQVGSRNDKLNVRWEGDFRPTASLTVRPLMAFTNSNTKSSAGFVNNPIAISGGKTRLYPYARLFDQKGSPLSVPYQLNSTYVDTVGNGLLQDWSYTPYEEIGASQIDGESRHLQLGLDLNYRLINGLQVGVLYNYENQQGLGTTNYSQESYYTRNLINKYTRIENGVSAYAIPLGDIIKMNKQSMVSHRLRGQLNFDRQFGDHHVAAILGGELSSRSDNGRSWGYYGYNSEKQIFQLVDYASPKPIYDGLSADTRIPSYESTDKLLNRFVSTYFNASYTYLGRYTASLSARKDAANLFGVNTNDRWNPLWSSGLSWIVDREKFMDALKWVDKLKLSFTYGFGGNSGGVASGLPLIEYQQRSITWTSDLARARVTSLPNADLKWEKVRQTNLGLSFSLFNNSISVDFDYYWKRSTDLLSPDNIDPTHGFFTMTKNIGVLGSKGFDLQLGGRTDRKNWGWNGQLLVSWNTNRLISYYGTPMVSSQYVTNTGRSMNPIQDYSLYPVFAYKFSGLDPASGDPIGSLGGEESKSYAQLLNPPLSELHYFGTGLPPWYGSFRNAFRYRDLGLSFNLQFKAGHYFQKETIMYTNLFNSWVSHADYERRWQQPGDEKITTVPSMVYPANSSRDRFYASSEPNIQKGDLVRLQDIQLSYALKLGKSRQRKLNLYMNVYNVGLLWKAADTALDPDYSFMPPSRTYTVGANLNF
ncbi:SusC/RagA family TonB-linked outer membrane protein [Sphingobacterium multivorum]|uniref:SusC/RagA family TonB-linked outer membrane protein n=1 Tax=Sphingobacterium TaxID=28453 RepID=UPI0028A7B17F|nr:SusC/RagA family TonB-linked outer membrane protein [Sphingobacterium sp.]